MPHDVRDRIVDFVRCWSEKTEIGTGQFIMWLGIRASKFYNWRERTLWNTAYLDHALKLLQQEGIVVPEEHLSHISPLGWEHITITGTYHWKGVDRAWGRFQPLRHDVLALLKAEIA